MGKQDLMGVYKKQGETVDSENRASTVRHSLFLDDSFNMNILIVQIFLIKLFITLLTCVNVDCKHLQFRGGQILCSFIFFLNAACLCQIWYMEKLTSGVC